MKSLYLSILSQDKILANIIRQQVQLAPLTTNNTSSCLYLCRSIIAQQLSTHVARVINERFLLLFEKKNPSPNDILALDKETLRGIGLSAQKMNYILAVADFFLTDPSFEKKLPKLSDEEIIATLTQIKGVGKWTVEMYLLFHLGRENIFSSGDLGIQKSILMHYNIKPELSKKELIQKMETLAKKWAPYKSYACLHLWQALDNQKK